jgi:hypothetical protein
MKKIILDLMIIIEKKMAVELNVKIMNCVSVFYLRGGLIVKVNYLCTNCHMLFGTWELRTNNIIQAKVY